MSHFKEREEKICLNCGAAVYGRFCHVCGQENIEPKESFWHLVTHFVYDIIHFDGKFFSTLKYLLFRPGYLSIEYIKGRRASYLHPIRMYVFTSAFFFLIFFSFYKKEPELNVNDSAKKIVKILKKSRDKILAIKQDSLSLQKKDSLQKKLENIDADIALLEKDSTAIDKLKSTQFNDFNIISIGRDDSIKYNSVKQYDSIQKLLPENKRDGFIPNKFERQNLYLKEKYKNNTALIIKAFIEKLEHLFPQMLFVSLPLFALLLQLLYRRQKKFYYVNHVVYTIHLYCATFSIILIWLWTDSILHLFNIKTPALVADLFWITGVIYWYKALRNFYKQRRAKTITKYFLLMFLFFIIMVILFVAFLLFSTFTL